MVKYEVLDSVLLYSVNVSANTMESWLRKSNSTPFKLCHGYAI